MKKSFALLTQEQQSILQSNFGFKNLRPQQEPVVDHILAKKDALVLMPTGGGKSLCYQFPALCMPGTTVVVSPLIALMKDQVDAMKLNGIQAAFLNSSLEREQEEWTMNLLRSGELKLLYLAPERLFHRGGDLLQLFDRLEISLFAIDESHCISQWGHDFRPDYVMLGQLKKRFPAVPVIALTATADEQTKQDILSKLNMDRPKVFVNSFDRPNIKYTVKSKRQWFDTLVEFILGQKNESGIIYCLSRKSTEQLALDLRGEGIDALAYHAGMPQNQRADHQERFIKDTTKIIVATIAFGMGIDKSNVRFVVHADLPKNIEGYYQETGRAGRDGLPSEALLFYGAGDYFKLSRFCEVEGNPEQTEVLLNKLRRMTDFADSKICRRKNLLTYFGESHDGSCGNCDNCLTERSTFDATVDCQKLLSTIARLDRPFGLGYLIDLLRGSKSEKIWKEHLNISTYGIGKELSKARWTEMAKEMIQLGLLTQEIGRFPTLVLNEESWKILKGKRTVQLTEAVVEHEAETEEVDYDKSLFEELRQSRLELAQELNVPAFTILADSSLREMSMYLPISEEHLHDITGFGSVKVNKYGSRFLTIINSHMKSRGLETKMANKGKRKVRASKKKKKDKISPTALDSLSLWRKCKNITVASLEKGVTSQTIQRHLADCVSYGEIKVGELLAEDKLAQIRPVLIEFDGQGLKVVKEHLRDKYSYEEIRFAQAQLVWEKKKAN